MLAETGTQRLLSEKCGNYNAGLGKAGPESRQEAVLEAVLQAAHPPAFGRRRVPPTPPAPDSPALVWVMSQVELQQGRLQGAAQSARPAATAISAWACTLASAGVPLSGMALAGLIGLFKSAASAALRTLKSIDFRRARRVAPPPNPLLDAMAQSWRGVFVRTLAYLGGIAVLSVIAAEMFQSAPVVAAVEQPARPEWTTVGKPYPAFHLILTDIVDEQHYTIRRHSEGGGRKDILSWGEPGQSARHFMVEVYRPGGELDGFSGALTEIETRAGELANVARMRESLPIETKFGPVSTVDFNYGKANAGHCVGFVRTFDEPRLQISGLSCNGDALVDRSALGCAIDRLTLMSAGSDPDIAKVFAQAELKRNFCGQRDPILYATPRRSIDPGKPLTATLRGRLAR
jgi:hypothetical protein